MTMKHNKIRWICSVLMAFLLLMLPIVPCNVSAASKPTESRNIAIVFDNSGSMYMLDKKPVLEWCRATYAMEVFASMLNDGDTLQIYPMHPIKLGKSGDKIYSMESPLEIKSPSQASQIREIFTIETGLTPIESIDGAINGLQKISGGKKYLVVLTDGDVFTENDEKCKDTIGVLDKRFKKAGEDLTIMYLGIGSQAALPSLAESKYFVKKKVVNTEDVLSTLTLMCNQIFGRDTLPKNRISGKKIDFDMSLKKLIVFVQGENISNLKVNGISDSQKVSSQQTKYSTVGAGNLKAVPDTSLQGMMVTYTDCAAGNYTIEYSGNASSVEVYYEPDADLDFVFTDADGNEVDPDALYEGEYKVSFGMKDAKTGKLISSDLLGEPVYQGSYCINGKEYPISQKGSSGEVSLTLNMGDSFDANLTVTYLSGYTISKDSSDFGWPSGGIKVAARPAGDLRLEISGGDENYSLLNLEGGSPFIAKVYYKGELLTGSELESTELTWNSEKSAVEIKKELKDDHYILTLHHKNPNSPKDTATGEFKVGITAKYTQKGSDPSQTRSNLTYTINSDLKKLGLELSIPNDYIVIKEIEENPEAIVKLTINGKPLTEEEFASVKLTMDCNGIKYKLTPNPQSSEYKIKFLSTEGIQEGDYQITASASYEDAIGRKTYAEATQAVTLSDLPLWVKWVAALLFLLLLAIIIWIILHIRVMPKHAHISKRDSRVLIDGEDVTKFCNFSGSASDVVVKYGGNKIGLAFPAKPGKESYLYKKQTKRYAEVVNPGVVKKIGNANIESATIASARYVLNDKNVLERKPVSKAPLNLKHGVPVVYSGTITSAGVKKTFNVNTRLNFKKK